jgi:NADH:ubiquinone oxidoreductase subunit 6 (subunit J)
VGIFIILVRVAFETEWPGVTREPAPTTEGIGRLFLGEYLLAFEAASVLLLVALIGAAMIVRRKRNA